VKRKVRQAEYQPAARAVILQRDKTRHGKGTIAVVSAGTSDIPVAEEAVVTAEIMGNDVERLYDVGVAGIHRLLANRSSLTQARVVIVCAGMEGALPSVVGGLIGVPVIAVPTSVGYGAAFKGLAALLGMMNSCASNVSVVNIDNGFGAGYVASLINRL
jgi:pyridinium-3,5-biscarboxylic acid mononucleotide synthase